MHRYNCSPRLPSIPCVLLVTLMGLTHLQALQGAELNSAKAARRVDKLLAREIPAETLTASIEPVPEALTAAPARVDDETYLRRVTLDLIGELPTPDEIAAYVADTSPGKRAKLVDRLLADKRFGQNWGRYWRDVMLYRRSDERAMLSAEAATRYLADAFNHDTPWDEIARACIVSTGNLAEEGSTALLASQWGEVPETAAEVSRVFLGVQIQCAQCHDHPTDRWKREQFHELAAFFARVAVRPVIVDGNRRGFQVTVTDERLKNLPPAARAKAQAQAKGRNRRLEHFMPDLDDPSAQGTLMQPVFFLTGQQLDQGAMDEDRRAAVADWITAPDNPWFAKAFVNRIWGELVGAGFYEPIDDLGPDRECSAPKTLDLLAGQFVEHGHDVKWLFRTITQTAAYSAPSRQRSPNGDNVPAVACVQPLRSDQLFNALTAALEIDERQMAGEGRERNYGRGPRSARGAFQLVFGFDPSTPRDELAASIQQALLMMNQPGINRALSAGDGRDGERRGGRGRPARGSETMLARLLSNSDDDRQVVAELYLRCLAREPKPNELATCLDYLGEIGDRREAFEDILWSLVNSTEFLYRQ